METEDETSVEETVELVLAPSVVEGAKPMFTQFEPPRVLEIPLAIDLSPQVRCRVTLDTISQLLYLKQIVAAPVVELEKFITDDDGASTAVNSNMTTPFPHRSVLPSTEKRKVREFAVAWKKIDSILHSAFDCIDIAAVLVCIGSNVRCPKYAVLIDFVNINVLQLLMQKPECAKPPSEGVTTEMFESAGPLTDGAKAAQDTLKSETARAITRKVCRILLTEGDVIAMNRKVATTAPRVHVLCFGRPTNSLHVHESLATRHNFSLSQTFLSKAFNSNVFSKHRSSATTSSAAIVRSATKDYSSCFGVLRVVSSAAAATDVPASADGGTWASSDVGTWSSPDGGSWFSLAQSIPAVKKLPR